MEAGWEPYKCVCVCVCVCVWTNCYSSYYGYVAHNYEYAGFRAFHRVQLIKQSNTDVCVHLSVLSLLGIDCNCWGQTKVSGNRCHPAVDWGLFMGICGTLLTGHNRSARRKTCTSTTSSTISTINTIWSALGLNRSFCSVTYARPNKLLFWWSESLKSW